MTNPRFVGGYQESGPSDLSLLQIIDQAEEGVEPTSFGAFIEILDLSKLGMTLCSSLILTATSKKWHPSTRGKKKAMEDLNDTNGSSENWEHGREDEDMIDRNKGSTRYLVGVLEDESRAPMEVDTSSPNPH